MASNLSKMLPLLVLVAAVLAFGAIAANVVVSGRLTALDVDLAGWLHRHATTELTAFMRIVSDLNSTFAVASYAAAVALYQAARRHWRRVATLVACVGGVLALNVLLKTAFQRARPVFDDPLLTLATYSFPSGHVAGSTVLYGLFVVWVFGHTPQWHWRVLAIGGAFLVVVLVALSRMVLGVHYLSDVVAAFAEGIGWLVLCFGLMAAFWPREAAMR